MEEDPEDRRANINPLTHARRLSVKRTSMEGIYKKKVWINSVDKEYEERLIAFLGFHYGNFLEVHPFSPENGFEGSEKDILLTDTEVEKGSFPGKQLMFTEGDDRNGINVFQSGHSIAQTLISFADPMENNQSIEAEMNTPPLSINRNEFSVDKEGKVLAVFSPIGGCGVSTFARTLAQVLQEECQGSILYLSMEAASDWRVFYRNESANNLSDLLYCLLEEESVSFDDELHLAAQRQLNGVYFIKPCTSYKDLRALTTEEWRSFFTRLAKRFSYVVLDMNGALSELHEKIFQIADRIYLLQRDSATDAAKIQSFNAEIAAGPEFKTILRGKAVNVIRRTSGTRDKSLYSLPEDRDIFCRKDDRMLIKPDSRYLKKIREIVKKEAGITQ